MFIVEIEDLNELRPALKLMQEYLLKYTDKDEILYNSKLVACELISNSLKHGRCNAVLQVELIANILNICVSGDDFKMCESAPLPEVSSQSGRGLFLVDSLCDEVIKKGKVTTVKIKI